jgi:hypothetical protein
MSLWCNTSLLRYCRGGKMPKTSTLPQKRLRRMDRDKEDLQRLRPVSVPGELPRGPTTRRRPRELLPGLRCRADPGVAGEEPEGPPRVPPRVHAQETGCRLTHPPHARRFSPDARSSRPKNFPREDDSGQQKGPSWKPASPSKFSVHLLCGWRPRTG